MRERGKKGTRVQQDQRVSYPLIHSTSNKWRIHAYFGMNNTYIYVYNNSLNVCLNTTTCFHTSN